MLNQADRLALLGSEDKSRTYPGKVIVRFIVATNPIVDHLQNKPLIRYHQFTPYSPYCSSQTSKNNNNSIFNYAISPTLFKRFSIGHFEII